MTDDRLHRAEVTFALRVLSLYLRLILSEDRADPNLGGSLLYAGELDDDGRALIAASNIAGAASMCATVHPQPQRGAIRDGIVDFVVTSLDEALRILKNEIRKRNPVAVCIAASPAGIEKQMAERGVVADIDIHRQADDRAGTSWPGRTEGVLVIWSASSAPAQWMPKLDAVALECLDPAAGDARRWLRMAPRYLGRLAQHTHLVRADRKFAALFTEHVKRIHGAPVRVQVTDEGGSEEFTSANWKPQRAAVPNP